MDKSKFESIDILDELIVGRVDPYIYAFKTNTVPNYLKIGDTYRPVSQRLNEWKKFFPELEKQYENKAIIDEENYFRDFSVHQYLEKDLHKIRLLPIDLDDDIYYSREFFKNTEKADIDSAVEDIKTNFKNNTGKYEYYSSSNKLPQTYHFKRGDDWKLRPNQKEVVDNFVKAISIGRKNLLMYAVMRFGKSFTSLCCALEMKAKLVLVVSAKADVKDEWKKTVESAGNFKEYEFLDSDDLLRNDKAIDVSFLKNKKVVLFLTLQDLQGENIKEKHRLVFSKQIDLLIVDETHFGARAESFGKILKNAGYNLKDEKNINKLNDDTVDIEAADVEIKKINAKIRLHLSGTPYRILMGSEFEKEDIISFVQFSDIVKEQKKWDEENLYKDDTNEWDNPYYGFPQMVRFAFNPNKSSRKKMEKLKESGVSFAFSKLFEPRSIALDKKDNSHKLFINQKEILDLLQVIDGSKEDDNLLGFLDYAKIKDGKMCRHMVMVLPYCASCDAMEELIKNNKDIFKNLNTYEIINISGLEASKVYKSPNDIKNKIKEFENKNKKTLTLTVNRMLTGSTVEQWDTMLYLKDTASPQEYDQSIFRLQNQYTRTLSSENEIIKENLKPQTLLVDFDPNRLFKMQEQKSLIYNVNTEKNGNSKLRERIEEEIRISPIITMNHNKIKEVTATNILEAIGEYNNTRSVSDEVLDIPVDLSLLNNEDIRKVIERQGEFNSKQGLTIPPNEGEGDDLDIENVEIEEKTSDKEKEKNKDYSDTKTDKEIKKLENQIKTYYQRILFFSFLTKNQVNSLDDILSIIDLEENKRLSKNLYLDKDVLKKVSEFMDPFKRSNLDYKIQNISMLANDESITPIERAITSIKKFDRMSESEVVTPSKVCEDMINLLPADGMRKIVANNNKFLDLGCKSAEYAVAIYNRLTEELRFKHNEVRNLIYAIPTSSIAYEFTRKFYEILDLNVDNIARKFNAYDLLEIKDADGSINYEKIKTILEQNMNFSDIKLDDKVKAGDNKVKFGAVVGNPPYQKNISDEKANSSLSKQLFPYYVKLSMNLTYDFTSLIIPARWFTGDAQDKSFLKLRQFIKNRNNISEIHFYEDTNDIFNSVEIKGGICHFISSNKHIGELDFIKHTNGNSIHKKRELFIDGIDVILTDEYQYSVLEKVKREEFLPLTEITKGRNAFGIIGKQSVVERVSSIDTFKGASELRCKGNEIRYISEDKISKNVDIFNSYKVFISKSAGAPHTDKKVIGQPYIGGKKSACTDSLIPIGKYETIEEAQNLKKYLESKFLRFMVTLVKSSQNTTQIVYRFVPLQDFTSESDIDWTKSIDEIDEQLFNKYNLTEDERNHIKSSIKDM